MALCSFDPRTEVIGKGSRSTIPIFIVNGAVAELSGRSYGK